MQVLSLFVVLLSTYALAKPSLLKNGVHDHHHEHDHQHEHGHDDASEDYYDDDPDRSYKFDFDAEGYSREESADQDGTVVGRYTYQDANGVLRTVSYRAGAGIGFSVTTDDEETGFETFGQKLTTKKEPLSSPTRLVKSLIPPQVPYTPTAPVTAGYPAPVENPVKFYAPPPPPELPTLYAPPSQLTFLYAPPAPVENPVKFYAPPELPTLYAPPAQFYAPPAPVEIPVYAPIRTLYAPPTQFYAPPAPIAPETIQASASIAQEQHQQPQPMMQMDASYSFGYESEDGSIREEKSDANGNIKGKYSYVNAEGNTILVHYSAGPETGFVIENEKELQESIAKATQDGARAALSFKENDSDQDADVLDVRQQTFDQDDQDFEASSIHFASPVVNPDMTLDKSYTFGYSAMDDISRSEVANQDGSVRGTYTIPDVNGEPILVRYKAGPLTGFVIENLDEVRMRSVPQTGPVVEQVEPVQVATRPIIAEPVQKSAPVGQVLAVPAIINTKSAEPVDPFVDPLHDENADRSYKFSYGSAEDEGGLRQEESDAYGNINGKYSYVNAEGNTIIAHYSAGPGKGFVIDNQEEFHGSITKATQDGAKAAAVKRRRMKVVKRPRLRPSASADPLPMFSVPATRSATSLTNALKGSLPTTYIAPAIVSYTPLASYVAPVAFGKVEQPQTQQPQNMKMDASFAFNVKNEDGSSMEERSDSNGERTGSYSYTNPDGDFVLVRYRAGRDGFVILNPEDVLPKAPQAY